MFRTDAGYSIEQVFRMLYISQVKIREIVEGDRADWARLRDALWPGSQSDHDAETREYFENPGVGPVIFVAEADGRLVGFLELDYRKYAPGCSSSPVPFIEGWYVEPGLQRRGIGRALVEAAEAHVRAAGHHEIASDAEIENAVSIAAHAALGYAEVERVVCFHRSLHKI
jgi:aminoglycoside 6'-N-acetyltransferase I